MKKLLIIIMFLTATSVYSATVTFREGDSGAHSNMDGSYIRGDQTDINYDNISYLQSDSTVIYSLIMFSDIFGNNIDQIPLGASITSASLTIYKDSGGSSTHSVYEVLKNWAEDVITWNNFITSGMGTDWSSVAIDTFYSDGSTEVIDVSSSIQDWSDSVSQNYGWLISNSSTSSTWYGSDDHSNTSLRPLLSVEYEYTPIPEPISVTLLSVALSTLLITKKK